MIIKSVLTPFLFGLVGIFAFAPFSIEFLIFVSYIYLINELISHKKASFLRILLWGIGHWGFGMSWIIVSVYYYGETTIALSAFIYILLIMILALVFTSPLILINKLLLNVEINNTFIKIFIISTLLLISETSRYFLLNGVPWLIPGNIFIDTITQNIYPIFGVSSASFLLYLLCVSILMFKNKKAFYAVLVLSLICVLPQYKSEEKEANYLVTIIQPSSDPFLKYTAGYYETIENNLLELINESSTESQLIVLPEAELPYSIQQTRFTNFLLKSNISEKILLGAWSVENNKLFNVIYSPNNRTLYKKQHLVPFGEYIPFISSLRGLIDFFDLPMSNVIHGQDNQKNIKINNNITVATPICFDIAFPRTVRKMNQSSDLIINISNDTWFGSSIGPHHHLEIARIRSIENDKWTIRATNDGYSAFISNKGTIVDFLDKGDVGILEGYVNLRESRSFYNEYGYIFSYVIIFISLLMFLIVCFRSKKV